MTALDPQLAALIAAPFARSIYLARVRGLVVRYELMLGLEAVADEIGARTMRLLREHPSALLERSATPRVAMEARLDAARREEVNLRAAAPLPAPVDRVDRTAVLAFADVEWLMRELRLLRRVARRRPPDVIVSRYATLSRPDPVPQLTPELVRAIAMIPRGTLLRVVSQIAGARHGVPGVRALIAPEVARAPQPAERVFACKAAELAEGQGKRVELGKRGVAVFRDGGVLRAIDDFCPHRGGPLHQGDVEGGAVICPLHGWAFDLESGKMRGNPRIAVPVYDVELEGDDVFVCPKKGA